MVGSAELINHSKPLSASEVGLNIPPHCASSSTQPLVPVGATNRDQRPPLPALWAAEKRPLVSVGGTNRD